MQSFTSYPEVNPTLQRLLAELQTLLGAQLVGLYLSGSLALDDFTPQRSDIDFVAVTTETLSDETFTALAALHERLALENPPWGHELEGAYIPQQALRRHDPAHAIHPHLERGGRLTREQLDSGWVIQRHILRQHGVVLAGPPPATLIDPILPQALQSATLALLHGWWAPMAHRPTPLNHPGYRTYAILTFCRILYTLQHGEIVSKAVAARWAQAQHGAPWAALIEQALTWPATPLPDNLDQTLAFLQYTLAQSPPPAQIRPAQPEDAPALVALLRALGWFSQLEHEPVAATEARIATHLRQCLVDESHSLYVATDLGQTIVGYVAAHWLPYLFLQGPEGFISELFVDERARGMGIGRRLLETIVAEAKARGCARLQLINMRQRESYQRGFYPKQGWQERPQAASFVYPLNPP